MAVDGQVVGRIPKRKKLAVSVLVALWPMSEVIDDMVEADQIRSRKSSNTDENQDRQGAKADTAANGGRYEMKNGVRQARDDLFFFQIFSEHVFFWVL